MLIRKAVPRDFEKFLITKKEFLKEYGVSEKTREFILKEFKSYLKKIFILAEEREEVIGYIMGEIDNNAYEKFGYIQEIFVKKEYRGRGISIKLKDKIILLLKEKGIKRCRIEVRPNNPALEVYKKWGFQVIKNVLSYDI